MVTAKHCIVIRLHCRDEIDLNNIEHMFYIFTVNFIPTLMSCYNAMYWVYHIVMPQLQYKTSISTFDIYTNKFEL